MVTKHGNLVSALTRLAQVRPGVAADGKATAMDGYLTAEISASAVEHNLLLLRHRIGPRPKLCAVVKADAYGHGLALLMETLARHVNYLAVATPEEALALRRWGYTGSLLVFFSLLAWSNGSSLHRQLTRLVATDIEMTVVSPVEVNLIAEAARCAGKPARLHVKIDSGMGRSGVLPEAAPALIAGLRAMTVIRLVGAYTQFAVAEEADKSYTLEQLSRFLVAIEAAGGPRGLMLHAANSAATIDLPQTHLDMVRPGLAVYGYQPGPHLQTQLPLQPSLRVIGHLMQVRDVPAGTRCGYGLQHEFQRPSRIGLVPMGYADGYLRGLSGHAAVGVAGKVAPVCGRISMDQFTVDLTDVPEASVGTVVEIISPDPATPHSVENLARQAGTIPYEITSRLGPRVQRRLVP